ncbi:TPA: DpnI domain-containing protein, partial [Streptococcus suis]
MDLRFNMDLVSKYSSNSQKARVLTENWVNQNSYCPNCRQKPLIHF